MSSLNSVQRFLLNTLFKKARNTMEWVHQDSNMNSFASRQGGNIPSIAIERMTAMGKGALLKLRSRTAMFHVLPSVAAENRDLLATIEGFRISAEISNPPSRIMVPSVKSATSNRLPASFANFLGLARCLLDRQCPFATCLARALPHGTRRRRKGQRCFPKTFP